MTVGRNSDASRSNARLDRSDLGYDSPDNDRTRTWRTPLAGEGDTTKGRAKQAAGDLTGDKDLEREGERDEKAGKAKETIDKAKDKASDAVDSVKDKFND